MRAAKKETTKLIHLIQNTWKETKKGKKIESKEQAEVIAAINGTLFFLEMFDGERGETHKTYFTKKYLSLDNNMSQLRLSMEYCISRDSVTTYCAMYLRVFERILEKVKSNISQTADEKSLLMAGGQF